MKFRHLMGMVTVALAVAACSNEEATDNWNGEIRLSSGVILPTRSYGIDTQIASGEIVSVWVDGDAAQLYGNNHLTADGKGGFFYEFPMFYPSADNVDIYAIHSSAAILSTDFPATPLLHEVKADQTAKDGYAASDLLYAIKKDVAPTADKVPLTFYHLLSKVEVVLKRGNGAPDLTGATVNLVNTRLKVEFTPQKDASLNTIGKRAALINMPVTDNDIKSIAIPTVITTDFDSNKEFAEAIIVPQEVAGGENFIRVTLKNGANLSYKVPAGETLKLESGKKYIYNITVDLYDLIVESSIEDWETVGKPTQGSAFLE